MDLDPYRHHTLQVSAFTCAVVQLYTIATTLFAYRIKEEHLELAIGLEPMTC